MSKTFHYGKPPKMNKIKSWYPSFGLGMLLGTVEILLFGYALYCLLPPLPHVSQANDVWLHSSISFATSRVLSRLRGSETWTFVGLQITMFAIFSNLVLTNR